MRGLSLQPLFMYISLHVKLKDSVKHSGNPKSEGPRKAYAGWIWNTIALCSSRCFLVIAETETCEHIAFSSIFRDHFNSWTICQKGNWNVPWWSPFLEEHCLHFFLRYEIHALHISQTKFIFVFAMQKTTKTVICLVGKSRVKHQKFTLAYPYSFGSKSQGRRQQLALARRAGNVLGRRNARSGFRAVAVTSGPNDWK